MNIKHLAIGCTLLGLGLASAPASAAVHTLNLGLPLTPAGSPYSFVSSISGSASLFTEDWKFNIAGPELIVSASESDTLGAKSNLPHLPVYNLISSGVLGLYKGIPGSGTLITSGSLATFQDPFSPYTWVQSAGFSPELLSAGNYYIQLSGYFNNPSKDHLSVGGPITVSAVPEISTWLMMLAGFAGLAFVGYRRAGKGSVAQLAA